MQKWIKIGLMIMLPVFTGQGLDAQHLIGKHKDEVRELMRADKVLFENKNMVNTLYNLLKYTDRRGNQTKIIVFSEQDTCLYTQWMCDYSMLSKVISSLNEQYTQSAEDTWHYRHEGKPFVISLSTGEWYFTLTTKPQPEKE